jgi:hypothetical protein
MAQSRRSAAARCQPPQAPAEPTPYAPAAPAQGLGARPPPGPSRNPARSIATRHRPLAGKSLTSWPPAKPITGMPHPDTAITAGQDTRPANRNCPSICPSRAGQSPAPCSNYVSDLGGAMGIRTPDLLHAMNPSGIPRPGHMWPDQPERQPTPAVTQPWRAATSAILPIRMPLTMITPRRGRLPATTDRPCIRLTSIAELF